MGLFFAYILKSSVCLAVFYLFFRWLMARETFHRFNRFALLGILVWSFLLPLMQVGVKQHPDVFRMMPTLEELSSLKGDADNLFLSSGEEAGEATVALWVKVALLIYLAGIVCFAVRVLCSMLRLWMLIKTSSDPSNGETNINFPFEMVGGASLIIHDRDLPPFSWMKYIVISRADLETNGKEIITHELAHIRNGHSWDLLVADACILFQWFNPAVWLLKQELQAIHEYEADESVLREGVDARQYQLLLIRKAVGTRLYSMANSLNHSKLKKRITMMQKEKSNSWARLKYLYVLPVTAVAVVAFARPEVTDKVGELSSVKVNDLAAIAETIAPKSLEQTAKDTVVYEVVDEMPEFPGGQVALMQYLQQNVRYPDGAKERGTQGRVTVRFVVRGDGSITDVEPLRSIDEELDAEAVRVIKESPKWKPGKRSGVPVNVRYTVPVKFALDAPATAGKTIYEVVEVMPKYPDGGLQGFMEFLTKNMKYPEGAKERGIQGRVVVQFVVDTDGVVKDPRIFRSANPLLDPEALRLVNLSPKWKPGTQGGTPVPVKYTVPIMFKLDGDVKNTAEAKTPTLYYVDGEQVELNGKKIEDIVPADKIVAFTVIREEGVKKVYYITKETNLSNGSTKVVNGSVTDEQGDPIVGACINVEGSTLGTVTNIDGKFTLTMPYYSYQDAALEVSYIGKESVKVRLRPEETVVAVRLKAE